VTEAQTLRELLQQARDANRALASHNFNLQTEIQDLKDQLALIKQDPDTWYASELLRLKDQAPA
jgi:hypothetical protein